MTAANEKGGWAAQLNWQTIEKRIKAGVIAVLPVGAGAKEHGHHLPMNTDQLQVEWLLEQLLVDHDLLAWPTLTYGHYPAFVDYPGSCNLTRVTFCSVVCEILESLVKTGANKIVILNTGISTIEPLQLAIKMLPENDHIHLINVYSGPKFTSVRRELEEQPAGSHADEIETSIMLAMAPDQVELSKAEVCVEGIDAGALNRTYPEGPNYSPSGVFGDATLANAEKGKKLLQAMLSDVHHQIMA